MKVRNVRFRLYDFPRSGYQFIHRLHVMHSNIRLVNFFIMYLNHREIILVLEIWNSVEDLTHCRISVEAANMFLQRRRDHMRTNPMIEVGLFDLRNGYVTDQAKMFGGTDKLDHDWAHLLELDSYPRLTRHASSSLR